MSDPRMSIRDIQHAFAAHIRDPERNPPPEGVNPERIGVYHELFFNNIQEFIGNGFPVLQEIMSREAWLEMLGDFFARHRCATPYFLGISEEFLDYLRNERGSLPEDPPFLLEMAHYEWVELALSVAHGDAPSVCSGARARPLECDLALSELAWPLAYRYPVHRIGRDFQPETPLQEPTCLAVYRDPEDRVRFLELNGVTYRLLQILEESGSMPAMECLRRIAGELGYADVSPLLDHGGEILGELADRSVIELREPSNACV
jgi:hypothetical protein